MSRPNRQLKAIDLGDSPSSWVAAGFEVAAVDDCPSVVLGNTVLRLRGEGERITGWVIDEVAGSIDGLPAGAPPTGATPAAPAHPNGVVRIDHVVVSTDDVARTVAAFDDAGLHVRGERSTNGYGSPMRQTFFWAGDVIVELIGPDPDLPGDAQQTPTPTPTPTRATFFGLALVASDLDATAERLGDLLSAPKDAVQKGRRIAGLRGARVGITLPIAVMSPHVPLDQ